MAYVRFGRQSPWYIFWEATEAETADEECLAVWHEDSLRQAPAFTYARVREMLNTQDFSAIPGFTDEDEELIAECLRSFVRDVEDEYDSRKPPNSA